MIKSAILASTKLGEYPLSIVARKYIAPAHRRFFHFLVGMIYCALLYQEGCLIVFAGVLAAWVTLHLPGDFCVVTIAYPLIGLFWIHYRRLMNTKEWGSDLSGLIMFTSLRIWMITFNVLDGRKKNLKRKQWIDTALPSIPSIYHLFSYVFSYTGLYSGPVIPYKVFEKTLQVDTNEEEANEDIKSGLIPWIECFIFTAVYGIGMEVLPAKLIVSEKFESKPYLVRYVTAIILSFVHTSRYILAWLGGEAGYRPLGIARNPDFVFEDFLSIRPKIYFSSRRYSNLANEWNHTVHFVFKEYIHVRLIALGLPNWVGRMATFGFSAYWHGFYSGYYLFAVIVEISSFLDRYRVKYFVPLEEKLIGQKKAAIFDAIWIQCLNYFNGAPWDLYWASLYIQFFKTMYFGPFIVLIGMIIIGFIFNSKTKIPLNKKE